MDIIGYFRILIENGMAHHVVIWCVMTFIAIGNIVYIFWRWKIKKNKAQQN